MKKIILFVGTIFLFTLQSCYYDNMEDLYPDSSGCDTTNITYLQSVWPVLQSNCTGCHQGTAPSGNARLENYNDIVAVVENGKLMGTIRHESGFSPMPKGGNKLSDCDITKLEIWINKGYPEN